MRAKKPGAGKMAYDKKEIFQRLGEIAADPKKNCIFIEDLCAWGGISKETYYRFFPLGSDEYDALKEALTDNRIRLKTGMRAKWYNSTAPALQMGLYKLLADEEEIRRLSQQHIDVTTNKKDLNLSSLSTDEIKERLKAAQKLESLDRDTD